MTTPNKTAGGYNNGPMITDNSDVKSLPSQVQPSPMRLKNILSDEKNQV